MNTLHEHLREMLDAVDKQSKIPNTRMFGGVWLAIQGQTCTMCAAGAWYAQHHGRREITGSSRCSLATRKAMEVMDWLRKGDVWAAYREVYGHALKKHVPINVYGGDCMAMNAHWRTAREKLLVWLATNNI